MLRLRCWRNSVRLVTRGHRSASTKSIWMCGRTGAETKPTADHSSRKLALEKCKILKMKKGLRDEPMDDIAARQALVCWLYWSFTIWTSLYIIVREFAGIKMRPLPVLSWFRTQSFRWTIRWHHRSPATDGDAGIIFYAHVIWKFIELYTKKLRMGMCFFIQLHMLCKLISGPFIRFLPGWVRYLYCSPLCASSLVIDLCDPTGCETTNPLSM